MTELTKSLRTHLINRRTTAYCLELALLHVTLVPLVLWPLAEAGVSDLATLHFFIAAPYLLLRDVLGPASWAKRLVGLEVVSQNGGRASAWHRILRNTTLIVPFMPLIELFVANYGEGMRRLGDSLARTEVRLVQGRAAEGSFSLPMIGALLVCVATFWGSGVLTGAYDEALINARLGPVAQADGQPSVHDNDDMGFTLKLPSGVRALVVLPAPESPGARIVHQSVWRGPVGGVEVAVTELDRSQLGQMTVDAIAKNLANLGPVKRLQTRDGHLKFMVELTTELEGQTVNSRQYLQFRDNRLYSVAATWDQRLPKMPESLRASIRSFELTAQAPQKNTLELLASASL